MDERWSSTCPSCHGTPEGAVGVCVCAFTRVLAVLGVRGPVRHEAGRRPELRTLSPTALVSTCILSSLRRAHTICCG